MNDQCPIMRASRRARRGRADMVFSSPSPSPESKRPECSISYIREFRDDYPELDYNPRTRELEIEGMEEAA
jgi:hypothetical protein